MAPDATVTFSTYDIRLTVVYDNYPARQDVGTAWGFACVIQGPEKTILFDTGGDGKLLLANMKTCGINPAEIDLVVISHSHWDHRGGLYNFLAENQDVALYVPASFSTSFKTDIQRYRCELIDVQEPLNLCEHVFSSGDLPGTTREQALILHTEQGMIIITGCAHPGILTIIRRAQEIVQDDILLVSGGFHLLHDEKDALERIVAEFRRLGVRYVAPSHCSGDLTREMFAQTYQDNYLPLGVGTVIRSGHL